jgi:hypothetical protein
MELPNRASGTPIIEVNGINLSSANDNAIRIAADSSIVRGLAVNSFGGIGIGTDFMELPSNNIIEGNFIGVDTTGTLRRGNGISGVSIFGSENLVGGTVTNSGNLIRFNGIDGVAIFSGIGNAVRRNSIYSNAQLGIDIGPNGVTPNDPGDTDVTANNLQNFPVLTAVTRGIVTKIQGTLNSTPNTQFTVEFFSNVECDSSGFGEGQNFIGSTTVTTGSNGDASFSASFLFNASLGQSITATATDSSGNTSEFSKCLTVTAVTTFDFCIQGDGSNDTLTFESLTGDYVFTSCSGISIAANHEALLRHDL